MNLKALKKWVVIGSAGLLFLTIAGTIYGANKVNIRISGVEVFSPKETTI